MNDFYIKIDRFDETKTTPVDHFSIRDHLNNLLSPSSTSRPIDYHSLQPDKFSIRVSFPHRQCFYLASFHTGKVSLWQGLYFGKGSLRQGLYSGKGSSLTRFLSRQDFTPASFHTGDLSVPASFPRRQAFTSASFHTGKILPRQGFGPGMLLYDRATFERQHMPPVFGKASVPKNTCTKFVLRTMSTLHRPFICS